MRRAGITCLAWLLPFALGPTLACSPAAPSASGFPAAGETAASSAPSPSDQPQATASPTTSATAGAAAGQAPEGARLSDVLRRDPRGDQRCPAIFPSFWDWDTQAADADHAALQRIIWLSPEHEHDTPVVAEQHERAADARCFAVGPHRGLNLANWCCRQGATERTVPPPADAKGLVATLAAERTVVSADRELRLAVAIENRGPDERKVDRVLAWATVLLLEVRDAKGARVPPMPPPTPPAKPEVLTLPPGGGRTFQHGLGVFSPELPPGTYTVRAWPAGIQSGELEFRIERSAR